MTEKLFTQLSVEQTMLKLVAKAPETTVARSIAVVWTFAEEPQGLSKQGIAPADELGREPGAARQRIVDEDLCFEPRGACLRECGPVLSQDLSGFNLKGTGSRFRYSLADGPERGRCFITGPDTERRIERRSAPTR